jgi:hypothetical protein
MPELAMGPTERTIKWLQGDISTGVKWPERVAALNPSCTDIKNDWKYKTTPAFAFMACTGRILPLALPAPLPLTLSCCYVSYRS